MKRAVTMHLFTEANEQLDVSNLDDKDQVMNEGVCIWIYGGCFKLTNKDIKNLISTIKTVNRTVVI